MRTEVFSCRLDVLHGGLGIFFKSRFFIKKLDFSAVEFYDFCHQNPGSGSALIYSDVSRIIQIFIETNADTQHYLLVLFCLQVLTGTESDNLELSLVLLGFHLTIDLFRCE